MQSQIHTANITGYKVEQILLYKWKTIKYYIYWIVILTSSILRI